MGQYGQFEPVDTSQYSTSIRVLFGFDESKEPDVWVKSKTHVEMVAPPTPVPLPEHATGTWVQLCNRDEVLFHRIVYAALFPRFDEVEGPDGELITVEAPTPRGEFEVVLPLIGDADHGELIQNPPGPDIQPRHVRFTLEELEEIE